MRSRISFLRVLNLVRAASIQDLIKIFYFHFVINKLSIKAPHLHRLLVFTLTCADLNIKIKSSADAQIFLMWVIGDRNMSMLLRKYTRDLMVFSEIFIETGYLSQLKSIGYQLDSDHPFIIDAGANIGCTAIFLHAYFPDAVIVCIEPEASNFELLTKNIAINNNSEKIHCLKKAIWIEETQLQLMQRDWSSDAFHVMKKQVPDEVVSIVETVTFAQLKADFGIRQIDLLKMDIEGAEKVFFEDDKQMNEFLPCTSYLMMEVHEEFISSQAVANHLIRYNFSCSAIPIYGQSSFILASKNPN